MTRKKRSKLFGNLESDNILYRAEGKKRMVMSVNIIGSQQKP